MMFLGVYSVVEDSDWLPASLRDFHRMNLSAIETDR